MFASRSPSQSRSLYTAKTITMTAAEIAAERDRLMGAPNDEWGTVDPTPQRIAGPADTSLFDWGIVLGLVTLLGGATVVAGATVLAAGIVVFLQADPMLGAGYVARAAEPVLEVPPTQPVVIQAAPPTVVAAAAPAPKRPTAKRSPHRRARARAAAPSAPARTAPAPTVPREGEAAMSLSQLRNYLSDGSDEAPAAAPAPAPVYAPAPAPVYAPAPVAPRAAPVAAPAPAPARPAPAPAARPSNGIKMLSSRLGKAPNGVYILDEPLDPVPVAIDTDAGAAIYVDGELLGGTPLAVVLDRGSHDITVQAEKGTETFSLDADDGDKWCFSVKRGVKQENCR